ncbi:MAG: hypothetical protein WCQ50_15570 [Spirochaetota bacterium]
MKQKHPIGAFLVSIHAMTEAQVEMTLEFQKAGDGRIFGEIAIEKGFIDDYALKRYVEYQQLARDLEET